MFKQLAIAVAALSITTAAVQAQCPEVGTPAKEFTISEGFPIDPNIHNVTAGGNTDLGRCASLPGSGWVTRQPDFVVNYRTRNGGPSNFTLTFRTQSPADTVLLVNGPDGRWHFNDDGGQGLNAKLSFRRAPPGRYDVWVGTYERGLSRAQLIVTELDE
jgi:hypothetical protein